MAPIRSTAGRTMSSQRRWEGLQLTPNEAEAFQPVLAKRQRRGHVPSPPVGPDHPEHQARNPGNADGHDQRGNYGLDQLHFPLAVSHLVNELRFGSILTTVPT